MYWRLISRVGTQVGRRPTPKEIRELNIRIVADNPTWGAPRTHGEVLTLGFDLSERTIARWMKRAPRVNGPFFFACSEAGIHPEKLRSHLRLREQLGAEEMDELLEERTKKAWT